MRCEICGEIAELEGDICWYCEEDMKEPDPYVEYGGYKLYYTRSVFPLMDEFEAEWGVSDNTEW